MRGLRLLMWMCLGLFSMLALSLAYELVTGQARWSQGIQMLGHAMVTGVAVTQYRRARKERDGERS